MSTAEDPRLAELRPEHAVAFRAIVAEPDLDARRERLASLLRTVGLEPVPPGKPWSQRSVGDPTRLDERARRLLVLLAETGVSLSRHPVYAEPVWLRRWLGIDPPGVLFRPIDDGGTTRTFFEAIRTRPEAELGALLATLPIAERTEVLVELLDGGQDFRSAIAADHLRRATQELDGSAGAWAVRAADGPRPAMLKFHAADRERAIFVALVRAKVPIEPRWDPLVPLSYGGFARWAMEECLAAIPAERRSAAVLARLGRANRGVDPVLRIGLEALTLVPDVALARWLWERRDEVGSPKDLRATIEALGKDHPALLEVVAGPDPAPALVPRAVALAEPFDDVTRAQLAVLARDAEADEGAPGAARRFVLDRDGAPAYDAWLVVDSGVVFRTGTADVVADVVQGGVEIADPTLRKELRLAIASARELPRPSTKRAATKKPAAKKPAGAKKPAPKRPATKKPRSR